MRADGPPAAQRPQGRRSFIRSTPFGEVNQSGLPPIVQRQHIEKEVMQFKAALRGPVGLRWIHLHQESASVACNQAHSGCRGVVSPDLYWIQSGPVWLRGPAGGQKHLPSRDTPVSA